LAGAAAGAAFFATTLVAGAAFFAAGFFAVAIIFSLIRLQRALFAYQQQKEIHVVGQGPSNMNSGPQPPRHTPGQWGL
jgi:hypothetical protein